MDIRCPGTGEVNHSSVTGETSRSGLSSSLLLTWRESEVAGYVYYEVDNFDDIRNPFMSLESEDPSMGRVRPSDEEEDNDTSCLSGDSEKPDWTRQREEEAGDGRFRHRI